MAVSEMTEGHYKYTCKSCGSKQECFNDEHSHYVETTCARCQELQDLKFRDLIGDMQ